MTHKRVNEFDTITDLTDKFYLILNPKRSALKHLEHIDSQWNSNQKWNISTGWYVLKQGIVIDGHICL